LLAEITFVPTIVSVIDSLSFFAVAANPIPPLDGSAAGRAGRGDELRRRPHPDAAKLRRRTSPRGGGMECAAPARHADMLLPCRDAFAASGVCSSLILRDGRSALLRMRSPVPPNGLRPKGWRAERRNPMASRSQGRPRGRLSARHMRITQQRQRMLICDDLANGRAALSP
jgi:hypothetical protein